ncbi:MAG: phosphogluconate dehydrogenase (NAD(+)-dependent, decarboxylating) [Vicinamibacterales bacterium]
MQLGMIGLGRMGANLSRRLMRHGHQVVAYDTAPAAIAALAAEGATGADSLDAFCQSLASPRAIWIMVPAAVVDDTLSALEPRLAPGDIVIDGGNSHYPDDIRRGEALRARGVHYVDVGTSGGVFGLERGYCLMIGGETDIVAHLDPIFRALAPGVDAAPRSEGRAGDPTSAEHGYLHCGPHGAGHFVKMVHNAIEYGMMAAYAEGFNLLHHAGAGRADRTDDAETAPLEHPEHYQYALDLREVAEVWRRGSVIPSWLLDLIAASLVRDPALSEFSGHVSDSGEGRWTAHAAIDTGVPAPVLTAALYERFSSRGQADYANRLLSAMRFQFGGHQERKA